MAKPKHRYNWRPDLPDQRDYLFSQRVALPPRLTASVDLREKCSPVFDQGKIGSCTGNALAGALEYLEKAELGEQSKGAETFGAKFSHLSRLFIYYNEREIEGSTGQDAGAQLRDGIKALNQLGACKESTWKYSPALVLKKTTAAAYKEAKTHTISQYLRIQTLNEMKQCLAQGFPFAFGFTVYESFESSEVAKSGIMALPSSDEKVLGGHAVLAVGYDDKAQTLLVRNSWGKAWGMDGYFTMPYAYADSKKLAQDFWTIRR